MRSRQGRWRPKEDMVPACLPACARRHAGRSRVEYTGAGIHFHLLKRDFFITMLQVGSPHACPAGLRKLCSPPTPYF